MNEIIAQYEVVSVADLYDLANVSNDNYAANKYGWTDIAGCRAVRVKGWLYFKNCLNQCRCKGGIQDV